MLNGIRMTGRNNVLNRISHFFLGAGRGGQGLDRPCIAQSRFPPGDHVNDAHPFVKDPHGQISESRSSVVRAHTTSNPLTPYTGKVIGPPVEGRISGERRGGWAIRQAQIE